MMGETMLLETDHTGSADSNTWADPTSSLDALRQELALIYLGLRFRNSDIERRFQNWYRQMIVPFTRSGLFTGIAAWTVGVIVYWNAYPTKIEWALPYIFVLV